MKYKLIISDLDGTMLNDDRISVCDDNIKAIKEAVEQGVKVVLCSGRAKESVHKFAELLAINKKGDFGASFHGTIIYDAENLNHIYEIVMDDTLSKKVISFNEKYDNLTMLVYIGDDLYSVKDSTYVKAYRENTGTEIHMIDSWEQLPKKENKYNISKIIYLGTQNELKIFEKMILEKTDLKDKLNVFFAGPNNFEFISKEASKGNGLKTICKLLNIKPSETIAIGDNENDISMIKEAGLGVAVKNAVEKLKVEADYITQKNNSEGAVAEVIKKFVLDKKLQE